MDNQIITLVLVLGTIIVLAIVALKFIVPLLEQREENKHEFQMKKLERGEGKLESSESLEIEQRLTEILEDMADLINDSIDFNNSLTNLRIAVDNINTSNSFIKSELETILERLEKVETLSTNLKKERDKRFEDGLAIVHSGGNRGKDTDFIVINNSSENETPIVVDSIDEEEFY